MPNSPVSADHTGITHFVTVPVRRTRVEPDPRAGWGWAVGVTAGLLALLTVATVPALPQEARSVGELDRGGLLTLLVFAVAVAGWMIRRFDDTFVALAAAVSLVFFGQLEAEELFEALGEDQVWLLVGAFLLAAGVNRTALPARMATRLVGRARSPRGLMHALSVGIVGSALVVPSTSGRAALVLPIYVALASVLAERQRLVRAVAVLCPTVVLLSAVATLVGAGAHVITNQILDETVDREISFALWLACGVPLALVSCHVAAELVLWLFTRRVDRLQRVVLTVDGLRRQWSVPAGWTVPEKRVGGVLIGALLAWSTEFVHGVSPALVAVVAGLLMTMPGFGTVGLGAAVGEIPWSLLLFMATTAALAASLVESGAAVWLASLVMGGSGAVFTLVLLVVLSVAAHLVVQSRSARSSVLIPLVIPAALAVGLNPVAAALASTAAAGFCHTLPASAKPVALFSGLDSVPTYEPRDLLRLSAWLAPVMALLVVAFAVWVWPVLGLPVFQQ